MTDADQTKRPRPLYSGRLMTAMSLQATRFAVSSDVHFNVYYPSALESVSYTLDANVCYF